MAKMLICYHSRTQHTQHMAETVAEAARGIKGISVDLRPVAQVAAKDLPGYDAIVLGSPAYYGTMAAELKKLLDESVAFHGQLNGKVGGAFASSALLGGGTETTVTDILHAMLVHGMIVQGNSSGAHYGAVAVGEPDTRAKEDCGDLGRRVARLAVKLHG